MVKFFIFQNVLFHYKWNETMKISNLESDKLLNRGEKCVFIVHTYPRTQQAWSSCSGNFLSTKMSCSLHDVEAKVIQRSIAQLMILIFDVLGQVSTKRVFSGPRFLPWKAECHRCFWSIQYCLVWFFMPHKMSILTHHNIRKHSQDGQETECYVCFSAFFALFTC